MLKRVGLVVLLILIFISMVLFTAGNPGEISLRLLHFEISAPVSLAFTVAFAIGWIFGIVCMGLYALKIANERRMLRRSLRMSEDEISSLRNLPLSDAD
jgi:uncharacterized membrane protein YciS (DUF1049 family)